MPFQNWFASHAASPHLTASKAIPLSGCLQRLASHASLCMSVHSYRMSNEESIWNPKYVLVALEKQAGNSLLPCRTCDLNLDLTREENEQEERKEIDRDKVNKIKSGSYLVMVCTTSQWLFVHMCLHVHVYAHTVFVSPCRYLKIHI